MRVSLSATNRTLFASALAAGAVGFAGVAAAQTPGDATQGDTQSSAYHGPYLSWAGKNPPPAAAPASRTMPTPAQEFASWPAPVVAPKPAPQPAYVAAATSRPAAAAYVAPSAAQPEPKAVHVAYAAPPVAQPARQAAHAAYVAPPTPSAPAPQARHAAPQPVSPPPAPVRSPAQPQTLAQNNAAPSAAATSAPSHVHFYSLHREYGLTPDKDAAPKDQPMVLIGPPDNPPAQDKGDTGDGKSDKHGDSEGADD